VLCFGFSLSLRFAFVCGFHLFFGLEKGNKGLEQEESFAILRVRLVLVYGVHPDNSRQMNMGHGMVPDARFGRMTSP
jgi:hypothetical protein